MNKNPHFLILAAGTIIFMYLTFLLVHSPMIPVPFTGPDMEMKIYGQLSQVIMGSLANGYILAASVKIFFGYFAFIILLFGHYHFTRTVLNKNME
jgi:hypothetical protein